MSKPKRYAKTRQEKKILRRERREHFESICGVEWNRVDEGCWQRDLLGLPLRYFPGSNSWVWNDVRSYGDVFEFIEAREREAERDATRPNTGANPHPSHFTEASHESL